MTPKNDDGQTSAVHPDIDNTVNVYVGLQVIFL